MKFSESKKELVKSTLEQKRVGSKCSECGCENLEITDSEYQLLSTNREGKFLVLETPISFRLLTSITCPNCGAVKLFDLVALIGIEEALKL